MTTTTRIQLTCPACGEEFESASLMSTTSVGKRTDFHPITAGSSPLPYYFHTCTRCAFTGMKGDFDSSSPVSPDLALRVRNELGPLVQDGFPDAAARYEFAARIAEWQGEDAETVADLYLHAAWCCVDEGRSVSESIYRRLAIEYFRKALKDDGCIPAERTLTVTYLVGELYRRVGEPKTAREWFDKVISLGSGNAEVEDIVNLALQQRDNPREELGGD